MAIYVVRSPIFYAWQAKRAVFTGEWGRVKPLMPHCTLNTNTMAMNLLTMKLPPGTSLVNRIGSCGIAPFPSCPPHDTPNVYGVPNLAPL